MLSRSEEKLVRSLHHKKGRRESGLCLVEGEKSIQAARGSIVFEFHRQTTDLFDELVTTETPQDHAAVARVPLWTERDLALSPTVVVLDGVQDPGNVGSILRLALGFRAALLLINSADPTSPKVIRSSAGSLFLVPWIQVSPEEAIDLLRRLKRPVFRLEKTEDPNGFKTFLSTQEPTILIAGSEGQGIGLPINGTSVTIAHESSLESLNVGHAVAIALSGRYVATPPAPESTPS